MKPELQLLELPAIAHLVVALATLFFLGRYSVRISHKGTSISLQPNRKK